MRVCVCVCACVFVCKCVGKHRKASINPSISLSTSKAGHKGCLDDVVFSSDPHIGVLCKRFPQPFCYDVRLHIPLSTSLPIFLPGALYLFFYIVRPLNLVARPCQLSFLYCIELFLIFAEGLGSC